MNIQELKLELSKVKLRTPQNLKKYNNAINDFILGKMSLNEKVFLLLNDLSEPPKCPYCNNFRKYHKRNYLKTCCKKKCQYDSKKDTMYKNLGIINVFQLETVKESIKQTNLEKRGVEYSLQSKDVRDKGKETKLKKYNDINFNNSQKSELTNLERRGCKRPMQDKNVIEKYKQTMKENHGVEWPMQCPEIFERAQQNSYRGEWYKGFFCRSNNEKDFLEYCVQCDIFKLITKFPNRKYPLWYKVNNEIDYHKYYPDFFIPKHNIIIEIKSFYTYYGKNNKLEPINLAKKNAAINAGFEHIFIIDYDYKEFNNKILTWK